ncbi:MAG: permease-like cell division protein FtsX [Gammaproteobacteria bacterium]|jgi:cell division protein FtsX|nr:permease-like cell division protein FtsX [Gammaproteobacteria bacterium]
MKYIPLTIVIALASSLILTTYISLKNINIDLKNYTNEKIIIFLEKNIDAANLNNIKKNLEERNDIYSVTHYTEEQSLKLYSENNKNNNKYENIGLNPLPQIIIIERKISNFKSTDYSKNINNFLKSNLYVNSFNSNIAYIKKITSFKNLLLNFSIFLLSVLVIFFIIINSNYIKAEIVSRKNKIIVYKIFGARNSFILIEHIYLPIIINLLSLSLGIVFSKLLFIYFSSLTNEFVPFIELTGSYKDISFVEAVIAGFFIIIVSVITCYFYCKKYFKCIY